MATLDTNRDGVVEPRDFVLPNGVSTDTRLLVMNEAVSAALKQGGYVRNAVQVQGVRNFAQVYQAVQRFDELTTMWSNCAPISNWFGSEREFDSGCWNEHVLPNIIEGDFATTDRLQQLDEGVVHLLNSASGGDAAPTRLHQLARDVFFLLRQLEGIDAEYIPMRPTGNCGGSYITGITYNPEHMPAELRAPVADLVDRYVRSAAWFFRASDMECEGDGCPAQDEVRYGRVDRLTDIAASSQFSTALATPYCKL